MNNPRITKPRRITSKPACAGFFVTACLVRWVSGSATEQVQAGAQRVTFKSGEISLTGVLYKPEGNGPFPALLWNHGSEKAPGERPQFDTVASIFVPVGYVVFAPVRRGHGRSEGRYILDVVKQARLTGGRDAANRTEVRLLESEQLDDQLAALAYLEQQTFIDPTRIAVAGCSFGGIETLLGAERDVGFRAAITISPGALSWNGNSYLQERLIEAVRRINIPVLLLQPARDASLSPAKVLGEQASRLGKPFTVKVYPPVGPESEQGHCFGGAGGMHIWAEEAKAFLKANVP